MKLTEDQKNELMKNGKFTKEQVDLLSDNEIDYSDIKKRQAELIEDMPGSPIKDINIELMSSFIDDNQLNKAFIATEEEVEVNSFSGGSKRRRRRNRKSKKIGRSRKSTRKRNKKTRKTNRKNK